jgi:hypothetical protein
MKRYATCIFVFAGLLILAGSAYAETSYRFEAYGSANIPMDKTFEIGLPQSTVPLHGEHKVSPGVRGGVRVGVDGMGHWGQDFSYSFGANTAKIVVAQNGEFSFTSRTHQFAYNVLFYPGGAGGKKKAFPYITAGSGGTIYTLPQDDISKASAQGLGNLKTHTSFTFNVGGGFRYAVSNTIGIRFDVRDWMSHPPRYGIPDSSPDPGQFVFPVKGFFQQIECSVALVYRFKSR